MPPRVPIVFLFVVGYFAVVAGGGVTAPARTPPPEMWPLGDRLALTLGEALALGAATLALLDAAWRPARTWADFAVSALCAGVAIGALWLEPQLLSGPYAVLAALAIGDAAAAAARPGAEPAVERLR